MINTNQQQTKLSQAYYDYSKELGSHVIFKTNNFSLSEDLVQQTFLITWKYLVKNGKIELMRSFLYHILNNLIVDEYRKTKTVSLDKLLEKGFDKSTSEHVSLPNVLDGKTAFILIKKLPLKFQRVMNMRYVRELKLKEISKITGYSKNYVAVLSHRGLKKLRSLYNHS